MTICLHFYHLNRYTVDRFSDNFFSIEESLPEKFNSPTVVCANQFGTDLGTCKGDSGGPMVQDDGVVVTLIGIVHGSGAIASCDGSRYPSIFTRVNHPAILNWIYKTVGFLEYPIVDDCDCLPVDSCAWSKEVVDNILNERNDVKKRKMDIYFRKRICNVEKMHMYCCGQKQTPPRNKIPLMEQNLTPLEPRSDDECDDSSLNVPTAINTFCDTILNNLDTYGQNLTIIKEALADDWNMRPNPLKLFKANIFKKYFGPNPPKGIESGPFPEGIKPIWDFVTIMMPDLKYERRHTFVINQNIVAVVTRLEATIGDVPPSFSEFSMFPGIDPKKLKGKSFITMALDVHILDEGKIRKTWHVTDWTLALDQMLKTGRDVGTLDWPCVKKGEILKEVPQCIYNLYDKILSDSNGGGQNNTLLLETMHRDSIVRPRQSILGVEGIAGLKAITTFFGRVMPDIKYETQRMWIHEDKVIVLSKVSATNVKGAPPGFRFIPSFPGVNPKNLIGKKFETLGISVHRIVDGRIKQTYHIDEWQLAVDQMLSNRPAPDFDFYSDMNF